MDSSDEDTPKNCNEVLFNIFWFVLSYSIADFIVRGPHPVGASRVGATATSFVQSARRRRSDDDGAPNPSS